MLKKTFLIFILSIIGLAFTACHQMKTYEKQEITTVVQNSDAQNDSILKTPTNVNTLNGKKDQETNRAEIMVIEYYTLIEHGLYRDAYDLINPMSPQKPGFDQYSEQVKVIYNKLDLLTVEPYPKWAERNGLRELPTSDEIQYFYVELLAWSKSETSSDSTSSVEQHMFIKLKKEGDGWTIYSFATNPPVRGN
jgi:hypothetical protein